MGSATRGYPPKPVGQRMIRSNLAQIGNLQECETWAYHPSFANNWRLGESLGEQGESHVQNVRPPQNRLRKGNSRPEFHGKADLLLMLDAASLPFEIKHSSTYRLIQ